MDNLLLILEILGLAVLFFLGTFWFSLVLLIAMDD